MQSATLPVIIQGGMGAGVSDWRLANAVSRQGQLGVISGTALDSILVRRLQDGDAGAHEVEDIGAVVVPLRLDEGIDGDEFRTRQQPAEASAFRADE